MESFETIVFQHLFPENKGPIVNVSYLPQEKRGDKILSIYESAKKLIEEKKIHVWINPYGLGIGILRFLVMEPRNALTRNYIYSQLKYEIPKFLGETKGKEAETKLIFDCLNNDINTILTQLEKNKHSLTYNRLRPRPRLTNDHTLENGYINIAINDYESGSCRYSCYRIYDGTIQVPQEVWDEVDEALRDTTMDTEDRDDKAIDILQEGVHEEYHSSTMLDGYTEETETDNHDVDDTELRDDNTRYRRLIQCRKDMINEQ
tara:strand:+ start:1069 stop:1851 length:783 start_codon:yes stop_codon:yes gene_type:complete